MLPIKKRVLTGDRPTGPLHVGHYVGSLATRLQLQSAYDQFVMIADLQALTDNVDNPAKVHHHVTQVMLDYLAVGLDPQHTTFFIQSLIPEIAQLTVLYLNLVTVNRLKRNPTIKTEIEQKNLAAHVTAGFLMYPVHQAADITVVKADVVPVGADQIPMIEQTNEIVRAFNRIYATQVLHEVQALVPEHGARLPGVDGKTKMSKSLGNAIFLSDPADVVAHKVMQMYTDPTHVHVNDPGNVEGNTVFTYLDIFDPDKAAIEQLKQQYMRGGLGDVVLKKRLIEVMNSFLDPIRQKRAHYASDLGYLMQVLKEGTATVQGIARKTMRDVSQAIQLEYWQ